MSFSNGNSATAHGRATLKDAAQANQITKAQTVRITFTNPVKSSKLIGLGGARLCMGAVPFYSPWLASSNGNHRQAKSDLAGR